MRLTILHLDDQPQYVSWIPGTLYRHLRRRFGCDYREATSNTSHLRAQYSIPDGLENRKTELSYELYYDKDSFRKGFGSVKPEMRALTIFDLHIGDDFTAGVDMLQELFGPDLSKRDDPWIFLTAFPAEVERKLEDFGMKGDGEVVAKPPNTTEFVSKLADAVARKIGESDGRN